MSNSSNIFESRLIKFIKMKNKFIFIFLFSILFVNAQSDTLVSIKSSVISLDKVKTVYRGIANPISIAVSDCKSYEVSGLGLIEVSKGKYTLSPGQGTEVIVTVKITNFDDSITIEKHNFSIANISQMMAKIDDQNCYNCVIELTKEEIKNAVVSVGINDFKSDIDFKGEPFQVEGFDVVSNRSNIKVKGNKFSKEALKLINKFKVGVIFSVENIRYPNPHNFCRGVVYPIRIMIKE